MSTSKSPCAAPRSTFLTLTRPGSLDYSAFKRFGVIGMRHDELAARADGRRRSSPVARQSNLRMRAGYAYRAIGLDEMKRLCRQSSQKKPTNAGFRRQDHARVRQRSRTRPISPRQERSSAAHRGHRGAWSSHQSTIEGLEHGVASFCGRFSRLAPSLSAGLRFRAAAILPLVGRGRTPPCEPLLQFDHNENHAGQDETRRKLARRQRRSLEDVVEEGYINQNEL